MRKTFYRAAILVAAAFPTSASWAQDAGVVVDLEPMVEIKKDDGTVSFAPAGITSPGDSVVYTLTYRNAGAQAATDIALRANLDKNVSLELPVEGAPVFSVDGGKTFALLSDLRVRDGDSERDALPTDVTTLRWVVAGPLAPGAGGSVSYRVRIR